MSLQPEWEKQAWALWGVGNGGESGLSPQGWGRSQGERAKAQHMLEAPGSPSFAQPVDGSPLPSGAWGAELPYASTQAICGHWECYCGIVKGNC